MLAPSRRARPVDDPTNRVVDPTNRTGGLRPFLESTLFVAAWVAVGLVLPSDPNLYLLAGIPLTVVFQLVVRRRPLRALWVREAPPFLLDRRGKVIAGLLMVAPLGFGVQAVTAGQWAGAAWMLAAASGAVAAAWALREHRRGQTRQLLHWLATTTVTGGIVIAATLVPALLVPGGPLDPVAMVLAGLQAVLLYFPVCFVIEEVAFRGAIDDHVHRADGARGVMSALFVSALWGLWHLPVAPQGLPVALIVAQLLLVHCVVGVPLSLARRRTGSLVVPAGAHALIDGIRNGLAAGL
jgi:membrane protease YdiL (CAAX protease family)